MRITERIPSLINGVSQQPAEIRLPSQSKAEINRNLSVINGNEIRPGTDYVSSFSYSNTNALVKHFTNDGEDFTLIIEGTTCKIFKNSTGAEMTVTVLDSLSPYFTGATESNLTHLAVADVIFVARTDITVDEATATSSATVYEAFVDIRAQREDSSSTITLGGVATSASNSGSSTIGHRDALITALQANASLTGYTFSAVANGIYISRTSDFTAEVSDPVGGSGLKLIKGSISKFSDLPEQCETGFIVKVSGDEGQTTDDYYVKYDGEKWTETIAPGVKLRFKPETAPYSIKRTGDTTFTIGHTDWDDRDVGDDTTNKMPSFVGKTISKILFYKNRLCLLSGEGISMSENGQYFNFFRTTITTLLATDRIDLTINHTRVSTLRSGVIFNERLVLFSDFDQFIDTTSGTLTPATAEFSAKSAFESVNTLDPISSGNFIYFAQDNGAFTRLREYFVEPNTEVNDAADITEQIPTYIKANPLKLATSPNDNYLALLNDSEKNILYVYKQFIRGREKVQSAWSQWVFPTYFNIKDFYFKEGNLNLVVDVGSSTFIIIDMNLQAQDDTTINLLANVDFELIDSNSLILLEGENFITLEIEDSGSTDTFHSHLDVKSSLTGVYDAGNKWTTWTLPSAIPTSTSVTCVRTTGFSADGGEAVENTTRPSTTTVRASGDHSDGPCIVGVIVESEYEFTTLYSRVPDTNRPRSDGRTQVSRMLLGYNATGPFQVEVTLWSGDNQNTNTYSFDPSKSGEALNYPRETGVFTFPIQSRNDLVRIKIKTTQHAPVRLTRAEWLGDYFPRARTFNG